MESRRHDHVNPYGTQEICAVGVRGRAADKLANMHKRMQQWPLQCDRASQDDNGDGAGRVTRRRSKPTQDTLAASLMVPEHVNKGTVPPVHVSLILSSPSLDRAPLFRRATRVTCLCELS